MGGILAKRSFLTTDKIDTTYAIIGPRFTDILSNYRLPDDDELPSSPPAALSMQELLEKFSHFVTPTLPHLLALLAHPSPSFPPQDTSLIIIESVSALLATTFPRVVEAYDSKLTPAKKNEPTQWASSRKWSVIGDFVTRLGKLAAIQNIAILLTSQTTTKVRAETGAVLYPAITTKAWDVGVNSRIVLFRDWPPSTKDDAVQNCQSDAVRFAAVIKAGGISRDGIGRVVPFRIEKVLYRKHGVSG